MTSARSLIFSFLTFFCLFASDAIAQTETDTIRLTNPSFEDFPQQGRMNGRGPRGWSDCGAPTETAPDIQPSPDPENPFFEVTKSSYDGNTYLGLVVRDNATWEAVGQRLRKPLRNGNCYHFSFYTAKSNKYVSATLVPGVLANHKGAVKIRIWGGNSYCKRSELLDETELITHSDWKKYNLRFEPKGSYNFIMVEAYYKQPYLLPYNGNVLVDKVSSITQVPCDTEPLASIDDDPINVNVSPSETITTKPKEEVKITPPAYEDKPDPVSAPKEEKLFGIAKKDLTKGQKLRIKNLTFKADSSSISDVYYSELNKIYRFLRDNKEVVVELGGHTNDRCEDAFCDQLSYKRAKSVADYLLVKGIPERQVKYKGYGKHDPVATNKTPTGRKRNQRVEVKIIKIGK